MTAHDRAAPLDKVIEELERHVADIINAGSPEEEPLRWAAVRETLQAAAAPFSGPAATPLSVEMGGPWLMAGLDEWHVRFIEYAMVFTRKDGQERIKLLRGETVLYDGLPAAPVPEAADRAPSPARPEGPLTGLVELAQAAQAYLDSGMYVGETPEMARAARSRLASLAGRVLMQYGAVKATSGPRREEKQP